jgi:hypothetical protein
VRTEAAPNPTSAKPFNASRIDSNRSWHEGGIGRDARNQPSPSASCRCRGEAGPVIAEVKLSPLPLRVVGGHRAGDVELPARLPQRD